MPTLSVDPVRCRAEDLREAVDWLKAGRVVIFPTDTFYGLAADPQSAEGVSAVFKLKGRDVEHALPLVAASLAQVETWCGPLSPAMKSLARQFWPGPLALICDAPREIAAGVRASDGTIAIRVPDHAVAQQLAAGFGAPITATSANRSGAPPARTLADTGALRSDPYVLAIDAGATSGGAASTIVDARGASPVLVRAGRIAWDRVLESLKE